MVIELVDSRLDNGYLPLKFVGGKLLILDQRILPETLDYFEARSFGDTCTAIKDMVVRGAPSIGVTAAFGFALEASLIAFNSLIATEDPSRQLTDYNQLMQMLPALPDDLRGRKVTVAGQLTNQLQKVKNELDATRPTAVNLRWGTERMLSFCLNILATDLTLNDFVQLVLDEAQTILAEHIETNIKLSNFGMAVVPTNANIITHCNAGSLAACGWGTALGVIRAAHADGRSPHVYVDETRPRNQGAKLTMWELTQDKIPATLVCDNMSGFLMTNKKIDLVVVGADRIARNGDTANKIGTFNLAIVAAHHRVPFYVAAPLTTFDATIFSGAEIPIEERGASEITGSQQSFGTVKGAKAFNPAFDVTPAHLIAGIITEFGVLRPPYNESISEALGVQT